MFSVNFVFPRIKYYYLGTKEKGLLQEEKCEERTTKDVNNEGESGFVPEPTRGTKTYLFGCFLSVLASCLRACSMAGAQMLDDIVGEFQLNIGRFSSMLAFTVPFLLIIRPSIKVSRPAIVPLILLALDTFGCNIFIYASAMYVPVGTAMTVINISFLTIILFSSVMNIIFGGVEWNIKSLMMDVFAVTLTCLGVLFVIQPPNIFHNEHEQTQQYKSFCNPNRFAEEGALHDLGHDNTTMVSLIELYKSESWKGYMHATLAGLFNAFRVILNKRVLKTENVYTVVFWTAFIATSLSLVATLAFEEFIFPESIVCTLITLGHACATGLQTVLLVVGMKYVHSTDVTLIYSFAIALLFLFQFTFLKDASPAPQNALAVCAAVMVSVISIGKPLIEWYMVRYYSKEEAK